ncbi:MAG TPA: aminopeptidase P N-terminal domain-containing protein, partial [Steroidobacteraceae bacterium]|nr:aminopeptidase P N-terminal domain-containing protein [Steroidobacteraceae bacterium]
MSTFDAGKTLARNGYDSEVPPNLLEFMLKSWNPKGRKQPKVLSNAATFRKRRERLSQQFPNDLLVIPTGHRKVRANDSFYVFRPGTDFYYLTGVLEPDCVLVMVPNAQGRGHEQLLFVEPNPGKADATFFTDRNKGELWEGPRLGVAESAARFGIACQPLPTLAATLEAANQPGGKLRVLRDFSAATELMLRAERS